MDRMSPQDSMFISVEDERNPMHIGTVSVFEGPAPSYGELVRTVASHLSNLPRYRQRARFVPLGLGIQFGSTTHTSRSSTTSAIRQPRPRDRRKNCAI